MNVLLAIDRFARVHFAGYTSLWPLLGAAVSNATQPLSFWFVLAAVGLAFHLYGAVLNDVVDLPIDRTQPSRAHDPLVCGTIEPGWALRFALLQLPIAFVLAISLGAGNADCAWLAAAAAFMAIYDVFGKRCSMPPITDAAQGLSWVCLTFFGAGVAGGGSNVLTWVIAATGFFYTLLINGVHGGMRDLANDSAQGARTTALWLGMRVVDGALAVPPRAAWFCWPLVITLLLLAAVPFGSAASPAGWTAVGTAVFAVASLWGMWRVLQPWRSGWQAIFRMHLFLLLLPMLCGVSAGLPPLLAAAIATFFVAPMALLTLPRLAVQRDEKSDGQVWSR